MDPATIAAALAALVPAIVGIVEKYEANKASGNDAIDTEFAASWADLKAEMGKLPGVFIADDADALAMLKIRFPSKP
jgi:hypothetical protein